MTTTEAVPEEKAAEKPAAPAVEPDPFWDIEPGTDMDDATYREITGRGMTHCGVRVATGEDYEGEGNASSHWSCTRAEHPDHWRHIALAGHHVIGKWGGAEDGDPNSASPEERDPDPGPDFQLEVGELYKFRNRPTVLQVVGFRRDGRVEVLDLTHLRYRVLKREQMVPRKDELTLTPEQVRWVGKFMAERRAQARQNALTQRRNGYFRTLEDLNGVLTELSLEPHQRVRQGRVSFDMHITVRGSETDRDLRRRLADWINGLEKPDWLDVQGRAEYHNVYVDMRDA